MIRRYLLCVTLGASTSAVSAYGQVQSGAPKFATLITKGAETINLGNDNVFWTIPVLNKQGRGLPMTYDLTYGSSVWYPVASGSTTAWQPVSSWGWSGLSALGQSKVTYNVVPVNGPCGQNVSYQGWTYSNVQFTDLNGVIHGLGNGGSYFTSSYGGQCPNGPQPSTPIQAFSPDGSGYGATISPQSGGSIAATVHKAGGLTIIAPVISNQSQQATQSTIYQQSDANGNIISESNGQYTDTTGKVALTVSGTIPSNTAISYNLPGGNTAQYTVSYKTYTVKTNFQCSGVADYGPTSVSLVDRITRPDSSFYKFSYEATPGYSGDVTARVASVTLPTGGTVAYSYYGGTNGIVCADGSTPGFSRTTSDGISTYNRAGGGSVYTSTVTDESNNQTLYHFSEDPYGGFYETHRQAYQGSVGGTPLLEVTTCYNNQAGPCDGQAVSPSITEVDATTSYNGGSQALVTTTYDSTGTVPTKVSTYSGSTLLVSTANSYNTSSYLYTLLSSVTSDASGNTVTSSTYGYDETALTTTSGIPQHGAVSGSRGNRTSSHVSYGGGTLNTATSFYDTGEPISSTDPGGFTTSYGYDPTQAFVTSQTLPVPLSGVTLTTSATYDAASGLVLTGTGFNSGQTTTVQSYDSFLRPTSISYPVSGASTTISYTPTQTTVSSTIDSNRSTNQIAVLDPYGREIRSAVWNGQAYYVTDSCYGPTGMLSSKGIAYLVNGSSLPSTYNCGNGDAFTYDALGRTTKVTRYDGSSSTWTYQSRGEMRSDSIGVSRITQHDLLGRITGICELSSNNSMPASGSPTGCSMDISGTGFITNYAYDLANHKATITQGVQTRVFGTDAAGRLTYVQEPERGITTYAYAYNSTGLFITRVRPTANQASTSTTTQTISQYDKVGRIVSVSYSDGTPNRTYRYDEAAPCCTLPSMGASKGQLTTFFNANTHSRSYAYDIMGRPSQFVECLPDQCGNDASHFVYRSFTYDYLGDLVTDQYATTGNNGSSATITYSYNQAGQLTWMAGGQNDSTLTPNILSASSFTPFGPTVTQYGNGLNLVTKFAQMNGGNDGLSLCSGSSQDGCPGGTMLYGTTRSTSAGQVTSSNDTATIRASSFGYDEFGRLKTINPLNGGNQFSMNATYDRYGNLWAENNANGSYGAIWNPNWSIDTTTNRITGYSYDAAGNRLSDGIHNYTFDAEGNMTTVDGGSTAVFVYDSLNERVKVTANGVTERYGFDLSGRRATTWLDNSTSLKQTQYYAGNRSVAYWLAADNHIHFEQADGIGTERLRSTNTGAADGSNNGTYNDLESGYFLWGPGNDVNPFHFANLEHDLTSDSGLEHAVFREYSSKDARWFSPDPSDGSYDIGLPQSFNRYTYSNNSPVSLADPLGLNAATDCTPNCVDQNGNVYTPSQSGDGDGIAGATDSISVDSGDGDQPGYLGGSPYGDSSGIPLIYKGGASGGGYSGTAPSKPSVGTCLSQAASNGRG